MPVVAMSQSTISEGGGFSRSCLTAQNRRGGSDEGAVNPAALAVFRLMTAAALTAEIP